MLSQNLPPIEILEGWRAGGQATASELQQLMAWELAEPERSLAFGIGPEQVETAIQARASLFSSISREIHKLPIKSTISLETIWKLWIPLALQLVEERQSLDRPPILGILGGQGMGKTTLAIILTFILNKLGYRAISLSLDDLYKTYADRQRLKEEDPRLIWRGPPGTHDLELGLEVLDKLRHSQGRKLTEILPQNEIKIPRFDKSAWGGAGDRSEPEIISVADIVLFEGWFVGVRPIDPHAFETAPPPLLTETDRQFARDMNLKLYDYLPLWSRLDRLMVLYPTDYRLSKKWRQQAEREAIARGKSGMTDEEIERFVEYFWKALHPELFIKPLLQKGEWVDLAVEIDSDRGIEAVYRPKLRNQVPAS